MVNNNSETEFQLAHDKILSLKFRYTKASQAKSFWSKMIASSDLRMEQIVKLESLIDGISKLNDRCIQMNVLTDTFNLSAVKGCYFAILLEIKASYTTNPNNFTNSKLVKILLADLNIDDLPLLEDLEQDLDNYEKLLSLIKITTASSEQINSI